MPRCRTGAQRRFGLSAGPIFLAVGGIEERKNALRLLAAFARARSALPAAQLVLAGGASLLDHGAYRSRFADRLSSSGLPAGAVVETGPLPHCDMPALYRSADALVFPSIEEGFGLVLLEAMASGLPVVASAIEPFTEFLGAEDAVWCDPWSTASIADAMLAVLDAEQRRRLVANGALVAARHPWEATARAHLRLYERFEEPLHA
jgi:glycosyltransferase involved in cell wall biosynthesis